MSKEFDDFLNNVNENKEEPKQYPIGGYAPGYYGCTCVTCKTEFMGDKRAVQCEPCAIKMTKEEPKQRAKNYMRLKGALEPKQTMNAKEKAKELIDKFSNECLLTTDGGKVASLIAVDEIKRILYDQDLMIRYDYWFEVKKEIEKL